ncbi:MAG: hypothetical protein WAM79_03475 [Candidatus Sulfotelmatobacter sp.]
MLPRNEKSIAELSPGALRVYSGFGQLASQGFAFYRVVPAQSLTVAEYRIQDEFGREIGRYVGTGKKSAILKYGDKTANLYIQGAVFGGSIYAGNVAGKSNNSIVIRDQDRILAEAERTRIFPASCYRLVCEGAVFEVAAGGLWPTRLGSFSKEGKQVGAFRRPAISSRNVVAAFDPHLSDESKVFLAGMALLG